MSGLAELLARPEPSIAVAFTETISDADILAVGTIADVAECRADCLLSTDPEYLSLQIRRLAGMPVLLTIRYKREEGKWQGTEGERLSLFQRLEPDVDGMDIELAAGILPAVIELSHESNKVVIVSSHEFETTPSGDELDERLERALELGANYFKIAAKADTIDEYKRLTEFTIRNYGRGIIVVAMGIYGPLSRVALPSLGSALTYAFSGKTGNAPGQMSYTETHALLKRLSPGYAELFS